MAFPAALASAQPADNGLGIVPAIGVAVIAASLLVLLFSVLKQPALLAYIVAGLILGVFFKPVIGGSIETMTNVSHLGLVFLLFIIGLEMDLRGVMSLGRGTALSVLLQGPIAIAAIWGAQWLLAAAGVRVPGLGLSRQAWLYFATAAALSSTAVVVKLLADKFDLHSQAGRVTVLTLIVQDIWAVLVLSYLSTKGTAESGGGWGRAAIMIGGAFAVALLMYMVSRHFLTRVAVYLGRSPDQLAVVALGWCFLCAAAFSWIGLSAEMGALVGGLTMGRLPAAAEIHAKVASLRDFFMALFFVALGVSLPVPTWHIILSAVVLVLIVVLARLALFAPTLLASGQAPIVSLAAAINLAQISEFVLLLLPIGLAAGALTTDEVSTISYALMLSMILATYGIKKNYPLSIFLCRMLARRKGDPAACGPQGPGQAAEPHAHGAEVVMLGYFTNADSLVRRLKEQAPAMLAKIVVIDFNLKNHPRIAAHGLRVAYGDISNPEALRHAGIGAAKVALCTISDTFLRGTSNARLLDAIRQINPDVRVICTADSPESAAELTGRGAFACICPPDEAAPAYVTSLTKALEFLK